MWNCWDDDRDRFDRWPPSVLSRFPGAPPCAPQPPVQEYFPSGYAQTIDGSAARPPLPIMQDASYGQFTGAMGVTFATGVQAFTGYTPAYSVSGTVGVALFAGGAIGWRPPTHGELIETLVDGFPIYQEAPWFGYDHPMPPSPPPPEYTGAAGEGLFGLGGIGVEG